MPPETRLVLRDRPEEGRQIEPAVRAFVSAWRLPAELVYRITLVLEELFAHALHQRPAATGDGWIEIVLRLDDRRLTLLFSDDGPPLDPFVDETRYDPDTPTANPGGIGLYLVRALVDEAVYERRGDRNQLRLVRWLPRP